MRDSFVLTSLRCLGLLLALGSGPRSAAASPSAGADTVVVTAARIPMPLIAVGSSLSVIDRQQIEARQLILATDLLQDIPGFSVSRSGSVGSQTQLRVRGAEANQVLVLIDGVEANDPAGNDEYALQDLTTLDIERIEAVRGPQSALWGSDALAGVVNVITRQPSDEFRVEGFGEAGAFDSLAGGARVAGELLGARTSASVSRLDSGGSNTSRAGSEEDGYRNTTVSLALAGEPTPALALSFTGRYTDIAKEFDGTDFLVTGLPTDTADETEVSLGYFQAGARLTLAGGRWLQRLRSTFTTTDTRNSNESGANGSTEGGKFGISYQTTWLVRPATGASAGTSLTLALDHERQDFRQRGTASPFGDPNQKQDMTNTGIVAEVVASPLARTTLSISGRYDDNSDFDDVATLRVTASQSVPRTETRLHAAIGTGQKAPTFVERFGFFADQFVGNPNLRPETSRGWEIGVEQPLFNDRLNFGLTYFREVLDDEINGFVFDPGTSLFTAANLGGESKRRGVELSAKIVATEQVRLSASYTYVDASQPDALTGQQTREIRRPRHSGSVNADWRFFDQRARLTATLTYTGQRDDTFFEVTPPFGADTVNLGSYYLAGLALTFRATEQIEVYARADNLLNENYEDVYGYNTPGSALFGGLRLRF